MNSRERSESTPYRSKKRAPCKCKVLLIFVFNIVVPPRSGKGRDLGSLLDRLAFCRGEGAGDYRGANQ